MAAAHRGHIIALYGGRAIYVPKSITLAQTIRDALDSFGLDRTAAAHFGFPHSDLAIMVEIGAAAFHNVRDGAILYLCTGANGPVFPHELAQQAQVGILGRNNNNATVGAALGHPNLRRGRYPDNLVGRRDVAGAGEDDEEEEDMEDDEEDEDEGVAQVAAAAVVARAPAKKPSARKTKKTPAKVVATAPAAAPAKGPSVKRERNEEAEEAEGETSSGSSNTRAEPYSKRLRRGAAARA